jgi:DNA-binding response OmpR family regulator
MSDDKSKSRILIVDDTVKNIQVLGTVLKTEGYQLNVAQNGLQALDVVTKVKPDLILLDVMMPELDGFETCKRLKADPETAEIPVVFLTAKVETDDIVKGFELGAVDYVTKPFNTTELLVRVNTHLQLYNLKRNLENLVAERTAQLESRLLELDGRDRLAHLQMSSPSLEEAYEAVLQVTDEVLPATKAAIYRPDESGDGLSIKMTIGVSAPGAIQHESDIAGQEPISTDDVQSIVAQTYSDHKPRLGETGEAAVPILYDEEALGVLWVDTLEAGNLETQEELEALWRLGLEAALCIRSAQMAEDLDAGDIDVSELLSLGE